MALVPRQSVLGLLFPVFVILGCSTPLPPEIGKQEIIPSTTIGLLEQALKSSSEHAYAGYRTQFVGLPKSQVFTSNDSQRLPSARARAIAAAWLQWRQQPRDCERLWSYQPPLVPVRGMSFATGEPVLKKDPLAVKAFFKPFGRTGQLVALERVLIQRITFDNALVDLVLSAKNPLFYEALMEGGGREAKQHMFRWFAAGGEKTEVALPLLIRALQQFDRNRPFTAEAANSAADCLGQIGSPAAQALSILRPLFKADRVVFSAAAAYYRIS